MGGGGVTCEKGLLGVVIHRPIVPQPQRGITRVINIPRKSFRIIMNSFRSPQLHVVSLRSPCVCKIDSKGDLDSVVVPIITIKIRTTRDHFLMAVKVFGTDIK